MRHCVGVVLAVVAAFAVAVVHAAPFGTLRYVQPTGVVGPNDDIEVWMEVTLDPASPALILDSSLPGFGVDPSDIPAGWTSLTGANTSTGFVCGGNFTADCTEGPPYDFIFNSVGPDTMYLTDVTLLPGEARQYLFGIFKPSNGAVPAGNYFFAGADLRLRLFGIGSELDDAGEPLPVTDRYIIATTSGSATFGRTVVPAPGTLGPLIAALGSLAVSQCRTRPRRLYYWNMIVRVTSSKPMDTMRSVVGFC